MDEERAREKKGSPASELKKKKAPSSPKPSIAKLTSISTRRAARMPFKRVRRNCLHCHHFFSFFLLFSSISRNSQPPHQTLQYWAAKRLCVCACVSNTTVFSDIRKKKSRAKKKKVANLKNKRNTSWRGCSKHCAVAWYVSPVRQRKEVLGSEETEGQTPAAHIEH